MSTHNGKTVTCHGPLDDDAETHEGVTLTFEDHGRFVRSPPRSEGFESSALRFDCPECGRTVWVCPVCSDHLKDGADAYRAPGYFRGETSGEVIPCHNCNQSEVAAQRARGY